MTRNIANESLSFTLMIMSVCGTYMCYKIPKNLYFIYSWFIHIIIVVPIPILSIWYIAASSITEIKEITRSAFMPSELLVPVLKYIPLKIYAESYMELIDTLNTPMFNVQSRKYGGLINDTIRFIKRITVLFFTHVTYTLTTFIVLPFFSKEKSFPVEIWLPFNYNTVTYVAIYTINSLCVIICAYCNTAIDILISSLYYHAATQLRILKARLRNLNLYTEEQLLEYDYLTKERKQQIKQVIMYDEICGCIQHYSAIYKFVKKLEKEFSFIVLSQFCGSIFIICLCCLQLSFVTPFTSEFFQALAFTISICIEIYLYCYFATLLFEESNSVTEAIYMSNWYEFDLKSKKCLVVFMEITQRPLTCSAGGILAISLETFTMILRRSYSLLAVLKNY